MASSVLPPCHRRHGVQRRLAPRWRAAERRARVGRGGLHWVSLCALGHASIFFNLCVTPPPPNPPGGWGEVGEFEAWGWGVSQVSQSGRRKFFPFQAVFFCAKCVDAPIFPLWGGLRVGGLWLERHHLFPKGHLVSVRSWHLIIIKFSHNHKFNPTDTGRSNFCFALGSK